MSVVVGQSCEINNHSFSNNQLNWELGDAGNLASRDGNGAREVAIECQRGRIDATRCQSVQSQLGKTDDTGESMTLGNPCPEHGWCDECSDNDRKGRRMATPWTTTSQSKPMHENQCPEESEDVRPRAGAVDGLVMMFSQVRKVPQMRHEGIGTPAQ